MGAAVTSKMRPEKILAAWATVTSRVSSAYCTAIRISGSRTDCTSGAPSRTPLGSRRSMRWLAHSTRPSWATAITASCMEFSRVSSVWRLFSSGAKSVLQLARRLVERRGHMRDFVGRFLLNTRRKVAGRDPLGEVGDAHQPAADGVRRNEGEQHGEQRRDQCRFQQITADAAIGLPDRRQRISHAHRAAGNRRRHIEQFHPNGLAQARGASHLAVQGGDELRPGGMVLHLAGIGLGVGQHLAGGVDDGHARVCRGGGLPGNLIE